MTAAVELVALLAGALVVGWRARNGWRRAVDQSRRIDSDVAFMRAIPTGIEQ